MYTYTIHLHVDGYEYGRNYFYWPRLNISVHASFIPTRNPSNICLFTALIIPISTPALYLQQEGPRSPGKNSQGTMSSVSGEYPHDYDDSQQVEYDQQGRRVITKNVVITTSGRQVCLMVMSVVLAAADAWWLVLWDSVIVMIVCLLPACRLCRDCCFCVYM